MTKLYFDKIVLPSSDPSGESSLPPLSFEVVLGNLGKRFLIDEDDGLFVGYGIEKSIFPYPEQNAYGRDLKPTGYETAILENDFLKATFLPCFGGKLRSLVDKTTGRELLFVNDAVRPCNLASRNAWLSGGIEWNACVNGHGPFTCSPVNTAKTELPDGTPVLRFYYFERIRAAVVQIDFFLPESSRLLFVRTRITNPNADVIPMYWWSNVAAVEHDGDRVIAPADKAFTLNSAYEVVKVDIPFMKGRDITYPAENVASRDYFWDVKKAKRRYIAQLGADGYGLVETSTSMLRGRKLFVWGNSQGGRRWMNFLTADRASGRYDEIQCGLAPTQYECVPMPPHTVWEWLEGYGAMQADPGKIHGDYMTAREETESRLDGMITAEDIERILSDTRDMAKSPAEVLFHAEGYGALELERRKRSGEPIMCPHLDFGAIGKEQEMWLNLLDNGSIGRFSPEEKLSYMRQKEWVDLLLSAVNGKDKDNPNAYYLLGTYYLAEDDPVKAKGYLTRSLETGNSARANYAMSVLCAKEKDAEGEVKYILDAYAMQKTDVSVAKETFRVLYKHGLSEKTVELYESASGEIKGNKRCLLYYAYALARLGRIGEAEEILCGKDGKTYLVVPDIRECETTLTDLWSYICERKGKSGDGEEPPNNLDFRMFSARDDDPEI